MQQSLFQLSSRTRKIVGGQWAVLLWPTNKQCMIMIQTASLQK